MDNNLLVFGQQLGAIFAELQEISRWHEELQELYDDQIAKSSTAWHDQDEWTQWDAKDYQDAHRRVDNETEIGRSFVRAFKAEEAVFERLEKV